MAQGSKALRRWPWVPHWAIRSGGIGAVTPKVWQIQGNVLQTLAWLISGIVIYSMLIAALWMVVPAALTQPLIPNSTDA